MHMTEQLNTDTIDDFIEAAIRWSDTKKSIEEIKRLKIEINKVIGRRNSMAMRLYKERQRFVDLVVATQKLAEETKNVKGISKQIATLVHDYKKTQPFTMKELGLAGPIEEYDDE
jgi:seryl-tRNA synthetase